MLRRLAPYDFLSFVEYTKKDYKAAPVHKHVADKLQAVVDGKIKRLAISMPPQSGKTELCSVRLPAYWLGHHPDLPVLISSYESSLAEFRSGQTRDVMRSDEYANIFNIKIAQDTRSKKLWAIQDHNGYVAAAGAGGPISGKGAGLGIIDDPIKGYKEAQSETLREDVWNWYEQVFRTRIWNEGAIVLLMTRWHEDDPIGRIQQRMLDNPKYEEWEFVRIPAIAETEEERFKANDLLGFGEEVDPLGREPGESLDGNRMPLPFLKQTQDSISSLAWAGLYQQVPRPLEGYRVKASMIHIVNNHKEIHERVRYWDLASTEDGGCRTAGVTIGLDSDGDVIVLDVVAGQWGSEERNAVIRLTDSLNPCINYIEQEPGSSGKDQIKMIKDSCLSVSIIEDQPTGNKDLRFESVITLVEQHKFYILKGEWNKLYIDELISFPFGKFKDQRDATAGALKFLVNTFQPQVRAI